MVRCTYLSVACLLFAIARPQAVIAETPDIAVVGKTVGTHFVEFSPDGQPLVGFVIGLSTKMAPGNTLASVAPIWEGAEEREVGPVFGTDGIQTLRLEAPEGFAVAEVVMHIERDRLCGLRLIYAKRNGEELAAEGRISSRWVGRRTDQERVLTGNGKLATGIAGWVYGRLYSLGIHYGSIPAAELAGAQPPAFEPTEDYAAALAEVEKWQVDVIIDEDASGRPIRFLGMMNRSITPAQLEVIGRLTSLEELSLIRVFGTIGSDKLAALKQLPALWSLDLQGNYWIDDPDMIVLRELKNIKRLNISDTGVTGAGFSQLIGWRKLEHLVLGSRIVDDSAIDSLCKIKSLKKLVLRDTNVTDAGLLQLGALKSLTGLNVFSSIATDRGFEVLRELPRLEDVSVNGGNLTSRALAPLEDLTLKEISICARLDESELDLLSKQTDVTELQLVRTNFSDKGFAALQNWKKLERLRIDQIASITGEGLQHLPGEKLNFLVLYESSMNDAGMANLERFPNLQILQITGGNFSEDACRHLGKLKKLELLVLQKCNLTDAALRHLSDLPILKEIDLANNRITGSGLEHLSKCSELYSLRIQNNVISDQGMQQIAGLSNLKTLILDSTQISDQGISHITGLTKLENFSAAYVKLTDKSFDDFAKLTSLQYLNLAGASLSDASLAKLKPLTGLTDLGLTNTAVTTAGLEHLDAMPRLINVYLNNTKIGGQGVKRLRSTHPFVEVWLDPNAPARL